MYCIGVVVFCLIISVLGVTDNIRARLPTYTPENTDGMGEALFLTPYIKSGDIETAQELSMVHHPKMDYFTSYSGFLTVDKKYNSNLFFWYMEAEKNSKDAPVLLWLSGGPGYSTFYGIFYENGPFYLTSELDFPPRNYSWHIDHHIIFIDNPVGTGFSFTDNVDGYVTTSEDAAVSLYEAMQQFFMLFPHLRTNDFFLCGESYGSHFVSSFGRLIHEKNINSASEVFINLRGMSIGNGAFDLQTISVDTYYDIGIVDIETEMTLASEKKHVDSLAANGNYDDALLLLTNMMFAMDSELRNATGLFDLTNYVYQQADIYDDVLNFLKDVDVRKAIHVGGQEFFGSVDNPAYIYLGYTSLLSISTDISYLLAHYPMMLYNGQLDLLTPWPALEDFLYGLDFKGHDEYMTAERLIWKVDDDVAGYVKQAGFLTEVLVRNSGHSTPLQQPKWSLDLIKHLTFRKSFD
ncbi:hypothetical protein DMENIID0001_047290 [Sergentomyia squamirostris]